MHHLLTVRQLAEHLQLSQRHIYNLKDAHKLPRPVKLGGCAYRWLTADIDLWIQLDCPTQEVFEKEVAANV